MSGIEIDVDGVLRQHSDMVYKIALSQTKNRADAEDVFQEVFLRLVKHQKKIQSEEHLKAWLIRVALNCCKKHFTRSKREAALPLDIPRAAPRENGVYQAVLELPHKYRAVIHLFYYEGFSVKEIGELPNSKESTVKSRLFRGRAMLRERLRGEGGDYV